MLFGAQRNDHAPASDRARLAAPRPPPTRLHNSRTRPARRPAPATGRSLKTKYVRAPTKNSYPYERFRFHILPPRARMGCLARAPPPRGNRLGEERVGTVRLRSRVTIRHKVRVSKQHAQKANDSSAARVSFGIRHTPYIRGEGGGAPPHASGATASEAWGGSP